MELRQPDKISQRIVWAGLTLLGFLLGPLNRAQALLFFMTPMTSQHGFGMHTRHFS